MLLLVSLSFWNRNVISIDDYASCFENIDPLLPFKKWKTKQAGYQSSTTKEMDLRNDIRSQKVQAVFIVSDSVDWSRDIQVGVASLYLVYWKTVVVYINLVYVNHEALICFPFSHAHTITFFFFSLITGLIGKLITKWSLQEFTFQHVTFRVLSPLSHTPLPSFFPLVIG